MPVQPDTPSTNKDTHKDTHENAFGDFAQAVSHGLGAASKGAALLGKHVPGVIHVVAEGAEIIAEAFHDDTTANPVENTACGMVAGTAKVCVAAAVGAAAVRMAPTIVLGAAGAEVLVGMSAGEAVQNTMSGITEPAGDAFRAACHSTFAFFKPSASQPSSGDKGMPFFINPINPLNSTDSNAARGIPSQPKTQSTPTPHKATTTPKQAEESAGVHSSASTTPGKKPSQTSTGDTAVPKKTESAGVHSSASTTPGNKPSQTSTGDTAAPKQTEEGVGVDSSTATSRENTALIEEIKNMASAMRAQIFLEPFDVTIREDWVTDIGRISSMAGNTKVGGNARPFFQKIKI